MVQLWLTLIGLFVMLLLGIGVFLYVIRIGVHSEDAETIDPLPKDVDDK
ncbi:hypothetical protein [Bacillus sp. AK128]